MEVKTTTENNNAVTLTRDDHNEGKEFDIKRTRGTGCRNGKHSHVVKKRRRDTEGNHDT